MGAAKQVIVLGISLLIAWLLWSGHYTPLLVALGVISTYGVLALCVRMDIIDEEGVPTHIFLWLPSYLLWLAKEIILSNLTVIRLILHPETPISPTLFQLRAQAKSELGWVILANSITLTPGTITIRLRDGVLLVHSLTRSGADALLEGNMNRRVKHLEGAADNPQSTFAP